MRKARNTGSRRAQPAITPDALIARWSPTARTLSLAACRLIHRVVPTATEVAYPGWNAIGFRDPQSGYFCGVFPMPDHLRLAFEHGAQFPDPSRLFAPPRSMRQVRYVEVWTKSDLQRPALKDLLRAAVLHGTV